MWLAKHKLSLTIFKFKFKFNKINFFKFTELVWMQTSYVNLKISVLLNLNLAKFNQAIAGHEQNSPSLPETTSSPCARGTRRRTVSTRRRLRRRWPTAKRRRQLQGRRSPCLPCVKSRAHGEPFRRVYI